MLGAIAGDIIGSIYERFNIKTVEFELFTPLNRFTDDTVLTVAVADAILGNKDYAGCLHKYGRKFPNAGYGGNFIEWLKLAEPKPYNSWGNGSAMRVSPVGFAFESEVEVLDQAKASAEVTHNHPEGIKGAQAIALAIFLSRKGSSKAFIKEEISKRFGYDLDRTIDGIRPAYSFDVSCQGSVPEAIIAFLESDSFEDAVRKAVSIGGDSDTIACMAGSIAEAFYGGVPEEIARETLSRLTTDLRSVVERFYQEHGL